MLVSVIHIEIETLSPFQSHKCGSLNTGGESFKALNL